MKEFTKRFGYEAVHFPVQLHFTRYRYRSKKPEEITNSFTIQVGSMQALQNGLFLNLTSMNTYSNRYRLTILLTDSGEVPLYPINSIMLDHHGQVNSLLPKHLCKFYLGSEEMKNKDKEVDPDPDDMGSDSNGDTEDNPNSNANDKSLH